MKIGLTLGKFAPLHCGHQHVIESSLAEMDHTIVLIYDCPELNVCPLPVRSRWIRDLYPGVEVAEAWDGPTETGLDPATMLKHDRYLQKRFAGRQITHFYSSEPYGEHVSRALGAIDRRVDSARKQFPVSASQIRSNPFTYREFLSALVLRDLIISVVFLGAPSTGKTTMAAEMAANYATAWVPEYGREYWQQHQTNRRLSQEQLLEIARGHLDREEQKLMQANQYLFVDTDATTTLQFSYYYHERAHPELVRLASETRDRYDIFFLCEPDIPYEDTWDRSGSVSRQLMHRRISADLLTRRIPFFRLTGNVQARIEQVTRVLNIYRKFDR